MSWKRKFGGVFFMFLLLLTDAVPLYGNDAFSITGRLHARGVVALDHDSAREDPDLTARLKLDAHHSAWRLHSWIEGGWYGTVRSPRKDHCLLKRFDAVYQDNTPYLELKELYVEQWLGNVDVSAGIQRFSWGRLDEYPVNDLLNPWDYTQFILKPMEDRKIGVPSISASIGEMIWACQLVWEPWFVPYRLPKPNERWSPFLQGSVLLKVPGAVVVAQEPDLPARTLGNGAVGLRLQHMGDTDWAIDLFHGYDPRPVFKTTALRVTQVQGETQIDPGFVPAFHRITTIGVDGDTVIGDWSLRGEAAFTFHRVFDIRQELWGYPDRLVPGATPLNPIEVERNTLDYGIAGDYRLLENWMLTLQAQQTIIFDRPDTLYDKGIETILWANLRVFWMNQKIETDLNLAYNPEHGDSMFKSSVRYVFTDSWEASIAGLWLNGPPQSLFGRYLNNDQIEMSLTYSW
jgi:hypothetical protein